MGEKSERPRIGVAGYGRMGANHARILASIDEATCAGVYEPDPKRRAQAAKDGHRTFETFAALLMECDAATIAAPTIHHHRLAREALEAGRHCLIEKPITPTNEEAEDLVALARARGRILTVGHVERFNGAIRAAGKEVRSPRFVEVHRLSPFPEPALDVGIFLHAMIYDICRLLALVQAPVASIDAIGASVLTDKEDIANARIRFEGGAVANLTASRVSVNRMRKIRIFESDRYISIDYEKQDLVVYSLKGERGPIKTRIPSMKDILRSSPKIEKTEPLREELAAFARGVARGSGGGVKAEDGANALEVALEIGRKIKAGGS